MNVTEPSAYFDQLVRQTRQHHMQLSAMADIKANILLTVSSLMLTFCIPFLAKPMLQWPALVMIIFCSFTALSSIMTLIPKLPRSRTVDKSNPMFNLLFFGSFADLQYDDYLQEMGRAANNPSLAYELMAKEIYQLGRYLAHQKFYYLRLGYQLFLAGLFCAGATFLIVELLILQNVDVWVFEFGPTGIVDVSTL